MGYLEGIILLSGEPVTLDGENSPIVTGGGTSAQSDASTVQPSEQGAPETGGFPIFSTVLIYAVMAVAVYFLVFRPQRKQAKELKTMQSNIKVGDGVLTQSGMYGRVADIGSDVFVIEFGLNKTIKIPVAKSEIAAIKSPKMTAPTVAPEK